MKCGTADPRCVAFTSPPRSENGTIILLYHRVGILPSDPQLLSVTPEHFAEHLDILKRQANPTSLCNLVDRAEDRSVPSRSIVVTFDDGYADSLEHGKPLLEAADIPATVFVVTGYLDARYEFWWDELDRILLEPEELPETFSLSLIGKHYERRLEKPIVSGSEQRNRHRDWNVLETHDPTARHRLYRDLFARLRQLPHKERREALDALLQWADRESIVRPTHRTLSVEQLIHLTGDGLVDIGAHSVTHPVLSSLTLEDQRTEIAGSKTFLEAVLGRAVTTFSYPFGARRDYTADTVTLVREAGFDCACSNYPGHIQPGTDRFQLPRMLVRDWDGDKFLRHLQEVWCAS